MKFFILVLVVFFPTQTLTDVKLHSDNNRGVIMYNTAEDCETAMKKDKAELENTILNIFEHQLKCVEIKIDR
jgi:hypothetical protein